ncbi:MAG: CRISPR-associated endonuclease Cas2 [Candidatus Ryanbacteria bacterium CG10_big_fil_rev_8_21_14_0_10_43_42]|uniref:CRISPR-associated endoribonuclease Cas2 n=1 Tax=Candidatus Ryanbacteria bacterium CG10_big_fil_rev_8_21_14_0_10_43_42 TaxID=1974864 RepID=A0A2M8KVU0_9BACT|nr:MAG: CRISPR-associated endonuclease Cas2 [Candidatus Ryanbacteria bacterium CG10_big_fil_rev_8_21_14_0_10_43_42]
MLLLTYDFSDDRVRAKFSKFLEKFGHRIQYSVFEIRNSRRVLQNIKSEIELVYKNAFTGADSVLIFHICEGDKKKIARYGYAKNEEKDVVVFE